MFPGKGRIFIDNSSSRAEDIQNTKLNDWTNEWMIEWLIEWMTQTSVEEEIVQDIETFEF